MHTINSMCVFLSRHPIRRPDLVKAVAGVCPGLFNGSVMFVEPVIPSVVACICRRVCVCVCVCVCYAWTFARAILGPLPGHISLRGKDRH